MTEEEKFVKKGAPKGNQYARKHGFYTNVLDEEQRADFEKAIKVEGLDGEIALMRVKIKSVVEHDPENLRLIIQGINALAKLIVTKYNIRKDDKQQIMEGITNVLRETALPIGIGLGSILK